MSPFYRPPSSRKVSLLLCLGYEAPHGWPWLFLRGIISGHPWPCPSFSWRASQCIFCKECHCHFSVFTVFSSLSPDPKTLLLRSLLVPHFFWAPLKPVALSLHWFHTGGFVGFHLPCWTACYLFDTLCPLPTGLGWEWSGRLGNIWWMNEWTNSWSLASSLFPLSPSGYKENTSIPGG